MRLAVPGGSMGLESSLCLDRAGSSSSSSLKSSPSLVAPVEEAASATPLKASSNVDADVRPWEKLDASPRRISCIATSSSDMQLAMVGSGVGRIPGPLLAGLLNWPDDWVVVRSRRRCPCSGTMGVAYVAFREGFTPYACSL